MPSLTIRQHADQYKTKHSDGKSKSNH